MVRLPGGVCNDQDYSPSRITAPVDRLRQARISRGLTQRDVAEQVGRRRAWVGKIEQCELRLDVVALVRVARAFGLKASNLVEELEEEEPSLWWLFFYVSEGWSVWQRL